MTTLALKTLKNTDLHVLSNEELEQTYIQLNSKLTECNHVISLRLQIRTEKPLFNSSLHIITDKNLNNMSDDELGEMHNHLILILFKIKCVLRSRSIVKT